jgi:hypothetical protein
MKNFIVYLDSGQIVKTGYCHINDFYLQGTNVIEGTANDSKQYIQDEQIVDMPPKPSELAYFDYSTKEWVLDYLSQEELSKSKRDNLLYKSDWTQLPNGPLTTEQQQAWAVYRQELRDITSQSGYPFNVIWPTPPQG